MCSTYSPLCCGNRTLLSLIELFNVSLSIAVPPQVVYGEVLPVDSCQDVQGLVHFISSRLFFSADTEARYSLPSKPDVHAKGECAAERTEATASMSKYSLQLVYLLLSSC